jgi:hypothetical protein
MFVCSNLLESAAYIGSQTFHVASIFMLHHLSLGLAAERLEQCRHCSKRSCLDCSGQAYTSRLLVWYYMIQYFEPGVFKFISGPDYGRSIDIAGLADELLMPVVPIMYGHLYRCMYCWKSSCRNGALLHCHGVVMMSATHSRPPHHIHLAAGHVPYQTFWVWI